MTLLSIYTFSFSFHFILHFLSFISHIANTTFFITISTIAFGAFYWLEFGKKYLIYLHDAYTIFSCTIRDLSCCLLNFQQTIKLSELLEVLNLASTYTNFNFGWCLYDLRFHCVTSNLNYLFRDIIIIVVVVIPGKELFQIYY